MPRFRCPQCSTVVEADNPATLRCPNCGFPGGPTEPQPAPSPGTPYASPVHTYPVPPQPLKTSGKAIASLVLGIVALMPYVSIIAAPIAIILGNSAKKEIRANPTTIGGQGLATAGIVLGIVGLVFLVLTIILAAIVFTLVGDMTVD